jgi:hypothetical protein
MNLSLTCENTNIELPYIDLANEIMGSWINHSTDNAQTSSDDESLDLVAEPKQILSAVYTDSLQKAWFNFSDLPYNFYLDKTRLLLKSLKTSRYELLTPFRDESRSAAQCHPVVPTGTSLSTLQLKHQCNQLLLIGLQMQSTLVFHMLTSS